MPFCSVYIMYIITAQVKQKASFFLQTAQNTDQYLSVIHRKLNISFGWQCGNLWLPRGPNPIIVGRPDFPVPTFITSSTYIAIEQLLMIEYRGILLIYLCIYSTVPISEWLVLR